MNSEELIDEAREVLEDSYWYEVALTHGSVPWPLYEALSGSCRALLFHHFWDEPWHPDCWVVRVMIAKDREDDFTDLLRTRGDVESWGYWERLGDDRRLYGPVFDHAMVFFQSASILSAYPALRAKLVHCVLNANGMSRAQEVRWALRYAYGSARLWLKGDR